MKTTRITIGRLFNLGNYEHIRYEVTVELEPGDSAKSAIIGLEKIIETLAPERSHCVKDRRDLGREHQRIRELKERLAKIGPDEFKIKEGYFEGTPQEYIARIEESHNQECGKRIAYEKKASRCRELLDSLGSAEKWTDHKLSWQDDYDF